MRVSDRQNTTRREVIKGVVHHEPLIGNATNLGLGAEKPSGEGRERGGGGHRHCCSPKHHKKPHEESIVYASHGA